jgi:hypothetical protein
MMPRMLIMAAHGGVVVLPVDEVDGIHNIAEGTSMPRRCLASRPAPLHPGVCCSGKPAACVYWMKSNC